MCIPDSACPCHLDSSSYTDFFVAFMMSNLLQNIGLFGMLALGGIVGGVSHGAPLPYPGLHCIVYRLTRRPPPRPLPQVGCSP